MLVLKDFTQSLSNSGIIMMQNVQLGPPTLKDIVIKSIYATFMKIDRALYERLEYLHKERMWARVHYVQLASIRAPRRTLDQLRAKFEDRSKSVPLEQARREVSELLDELMDIISEF